MKKIALLLTCVMIFESIFSGPVNATEADFFGDPEQSIICEFSDVSDCDVSSNDVLGNMVLDNDVAGEDVSVGDTVEWQVSSGDIAEADVSANDMIVEEIPAESSAPAENGVVENSEKISVFPYAYFYPEGYLVVFYVNEDSLWNKKYDPVSYTVNGVTKTAEPVKTNSYTANCFGAYIDPDMVEKDTTQEVSFQITYKNNGETVFEGVKQAQITFVGESDEIIYPYAEDSFLAIDGKSMELDKTLYLGEAEATLTKVALRNQAGEEVVVCDNWNKQAKVEPESYACDSRYREFEYSYRIEQMPYCAYVGEYLNFSKFVENGTYDLIIYQGKGENVVKHIFPKDVQVYREPLLTMAGWTTADRIFRFDSLGTKYVSIWVYGLNLSNATIPVLWQDGRAVTGAMIDCEPLEYKKGMVYKLEKKSGFSNLAEATDIKMDGATIYNPYEDELNQSSISEGLYPLVWLQDGVLMADIHDDCSVNRMRIYLAENFAAVDQTVGVELLDRGYNPLCEKEFKTVQKDVAGRLYVQIDNIKKICSQVPKDDDLFYVNVTNKYATTSQYLAFVASDTTLAREDYYKWYWSQRGGVHLDNLSVPEGYRWQIMCISDVGKILFEGTNTGEAVLTQAQLETLYEYGCVRVNLWKDDIVVKQYEVFFNNASNKPDEKLKEAVEKGAAPKIEIVSDSTTTRSVDVRVINPDYVLNAPAESLQYLFAVTDALGEVTYRYEYVQPIKKQRVTLEIPDLIGGKYKVTVNILYVINEDILAKSKISEKRTFQLVEPYEQSLSVKALGTGVYQGDTTVNSVAQVRWRNADVNYRTVSIELLKGPKGCDLSLLSNAFYYDAEDACIKFRLNTESAWNGVRAGKYQLNIKAAQQSGKEPAQRTVNVVILQSPKKIEVTTPLVRYYKTTGKSLRIKPTLVEYDYADVLISENNRGKTTYSFKWYDKTYQDLLKMKPETGIVTVDSIFGAEGDKVIFAIEVKDARGKTAKTADITVSSEKRDISSIKLGDKTQEYLQGVFAYEVNDKAIVLRDQNNQLINSRDVKFSVKGSSVQITEMGVVKTTGKAGKSVITAKLKDGSGTVATISLDILLDKVNLKAYYEYTKDAIPLMVSTAEKPNVVSTIIYNGDPILFKLIGTNGKVASQNGNAVSYKIRSSKGKLYDYGKVSNNLKVSSGEYVYVPKAAEDTITVTDYSTNPATISIYKIEVPSLDADVVPQLSVKKKKNVIYTQMGEGQELSFDLKQDVNYTGCKVVIDSNYIEACCSAKTWMNYKYVKTQFLTGHVVNGNQIVFPIAANNKYAIPTGTYKMNLFLTKDKTVLAPIPVVITVAYIPKVSASLVNNPIKMNTSNSVTALKIELKRAQSVEVIGVDNCLIGDTNRYNAFSNYFAVDMVADRPRIVYLGKDITLVQKRDRSGIIYYKVKDLAGFEHVKSFKVKIDIK